MTALTRFRPALLSLLFGLALVACGKPSPSPAPTRDADKAGEENHAPEEAVHGEEGHEEEGHEEGEAIELSAEAVATAGIVTAPAESRRLRAELETTGSVDFDERRFAHVSPRVGGRVESVPVELGEAVRAGQVLARIDSIELGQSVGDYLQSRARAELARETLEREERLYRERVSSEQEMLSARAASREADAALRGAEERLHLLGISNDDVAQLGYDQPRVSIHEVRAPFAGTIVAKHVTRGEMVEPQSQLFQVADLSRVWVWIDVYERDLARVHLGDGVTVEVDTYPGTSFTGEVVHLGSSIQSDTRTARARIEVPNPEGRLRPGMFARVHILDPHASADAPGAVEVIAVPAAAVQRDGDRSIVFVALGEGRFEPRTVRLGRRGEGFVEVLEGVAAGEPVVVEGAFFVKSELAREELGGGHGH
ncbi:MAG: efflux RND transporter periplasmic adaptor subunit [Thermoanaerobaculia bacterium]|nr:efflux RND transporter periplasmic adaptor subunit [Thermoanaerobaculia bacterium]